MTPRDQFLTANGLCLHYLKWGKPGTRAVVLLHGGCAHAHWWDFFAAAIADTHHVLALDLRGHGDSERPNPSAYGIEDYTNDLAAFVEVLDLKRIDLVGHSLGAMIAAAYAARSPACLRTLVLVDSQARLGASGVRYMRRLRNFPHPYYRSYEQAVQRFRLLPTQNNAAPAVLKHIAAHAVTRLPDGRWTLRFDRESLAHAQPLDLVPGLRQFTGPILFVRGAHSTLLSHEAMTRLLAAVPHAESAEIPDANHHVMLDNPSAFGLAVRTFLERH